MDTNVLSVCARFLEFIPRRDITEMMKILGIDPGTALIGWAIVEDNHGIIRVHNYGAIRSLKSSSQQERLLSINTNLSRIIRIYQPDCASVEELFFASNAKTAISVGEARGAILLTAALMSIPVISYTPLTIKQTICGDGKAEKQAVAKMVKQILKLADIPKPDDVTDALAIALTHVYSHKLKGVIR